MPTPFKVMPLPDDSKAVYTVAPGDGSCPPKNVHRAELNENNFTASSQQWITINEKIPTNPHMQKK